MNLSIALKARGHDVHIACLRKASTLAGRAEEGGIEVIAFGKGDGFSPATMMSMARYFRRRRIDVVHTHNPLVHHYGALAGRIAGAKSVINTIHGMNNISERPAFREFLFRAMCALTDRVVAVSRSAYDFFRTSIAIPNGKLVVIENGVLLQPFLAIDRRPVGREFVFGTVGRLAPVKDHATLLKAFSLLASKAPESRLEILGDGPLRAELETMPEVATLGARVRFRGYSSDVAAFLAGIDCFVLCSISEGLPLALLEAMASGLPVIGTAVGGISDLISGSGCGWLCSPSDPGSLGELMLIALESKERSLMARRARNLVVQRYSLARMAEEYETLFEESVPRASVLHWIQ